MPALEQRRHATVERLALAYARGELATDSLEHRLEVALAAGEPGALHAALWGLPSRPAAAAMVAGLRLGDRVLPGTQERAVWVVGRSRTCAVRLDEETVSARHARIACRGGRWSVADLGSTNGTWVNGLRVDHAELASGDRLELGTLSGGLEG